MTIQLSAQIENIIYKINNVSIDKKDRRAAIKELDSILYVLIKNQNQLTPDFIDKNSLLKLKETLTEDRSLFSAFTDFRIHIIAKSSFSPYFLSSNYSDFNTTVSNFFKTDEIPDHSAFFEISQRTINTFHDKFMQFMQSSVNFTKEHFDLIQRVLNQLWKHLNFETKLCYINLISSKLISNQNQFKSINEPSVPIDFLDFTKNITQEISKDTLLWQASHYLQMCAKHRESLAAITGNGSTEEKWNHLLKLYSIDPEGLLELIPNIYNLHPEILDIDQFLIFYQLNLNIIANIYIPIMGRNSATFHKVSNTFLLKRSAQILWEKIAIQEYYDSVMTYEERMHIKSSIDSFHSIIETLCRKSFFNLNNSYMILESRANSIKICYPYLMAQMKVLSKTEIEVEELTNQQLANDRPFFKIHLPHIVNNLKQSILLIKSGQKGTLHLRQYCELITLANQKGLLDDSEKLSIYLNFIQQMPEHVKSNDDLKKVIQAAIAIQQMGYNFSWNQILPNDCKKYLQDQFENEEFLSSFKDLFSNNFNALASLYISQLNHAAKQSSENKQLGMLNQILSDINGNENLKRSFHELFLDFLNNTEFASDIIDLMNKFIKQIWTYLNEDNQKLYCKVLADKYTIANAYYFTYDLINIVSNNIDRNHPFHHLKSLLSNHDFVTELLNSNVTIDSPEKQIVAKFLESMLPHINPNLNEEGTLELVISHYPLIAKKFVNIDVVFHDEILNQFFLKPSLLTEDKTTIPPVYFPAHFEKLLHIYAKSDLINFFHNYESKIDARYDISTKYLFLNAMLNALPAHEPHDQILQVQLQQIKISLFPKIIYGLSSGTNNALNIHQFNHLLIQSIYKGVIPKNSAEYTFIKNAKYIQKIQSKDDVIPLLEALSMFNRIGHQFQIVNFLGVELMEQLNHLRCLDPEGLEATLTSHSLLYPEAVSELYCTLFSRKYSNENHESPINQALLGLAISRINHPYLFVENYIYFLSTCFYLNDIINILNHAISINCNHKNIRLILNAIFNSYQSTNNPDPDFVKKFAELGNRIGW